MRITAIAAATSPMPYVTVFADPSSSSSASMSCSGIDRGGGGCGTTGGRQVAGGGSARGGPAYVGPGPGAGAAGGGRNASGSDSGRCQYASSSGTPVEELTFTDGTAEARRRRGRRGLTLVPWTSWISQNATPTATARSTSSRRRPLCCPTRLATTRNAAGANATTRTTTVSSRTARRTGDSVRARGRAGRPARRA